MTKKFKILYKTLFLSIIFIFLLSSCDLESTKIPLQEAVTAQYNLYMKAEKSDKLPITEEEIKEVLEYYKESTNKEVKYMLSNFNVKEIPDDKLETISKKSLEISKKIDSKIEIESEEKELASIKITAKIIDESAYDKKFEDEVSNLSEEEVKDPNLILNVYEKYLDEIIKNPIYKDKEETVNITLTKIDNEWLMNDEGALDKLNKLIPR